MIQLSDGRKYTSEQVQRDINMGLQGQSGLKVLDLLMLAEGMINYILTLEKEVTPK